MNHVTYVTEEILIILKILAYIRYIMATIGIKEFISLVADMKSS